MNEKIARLISAAVTLLGVILFAVFNIVGSITADPFVAVVLLVALLFAVGLAVMALLGKTGVIVLVLLGFWAFLPLICGNVFIGWIVLFAAVLLKSFFRGKTNVFPKLFWIPAAVELLVHIRSIIHLYNYIEFIVPLIADLIICLGLGLWFVGYAPAMLRTKEDVKDSRITYYEDLLARGVITKEEFDRKLNELCEK